MNDGTEGAQAICSTGQHLDLSSGSTGHLQYESTPGSYLQEHRPSAALVSLARVLLGEPHGLKPSL